MTRRFLRRAAPCAALLAVLVPVAGALGAPPSPTAVATPTTTRFGDTIVYVVEARVPAGAAAAVDAPIGPFTAVAAPRTTRSEHGDTVTIRVVQSLACLTLGCVPGKGGRRVTLRAPQVRIGSDVTRGAPVTVVLQPRVGVAAVAADAPRFERPVTLAEPTLRSPGVGSGMLVVGTLLVAGGVLALALLALRAHRRSRGVVVDPVERAARLLRESATRSAPDRRRAASLASRVVREHALRRDAERVAWARPAPEPVDAEQLAGKVERSAEAAR